MCESNSYFAEQEKILEEILSPITKQAKVWALTKQLVENMWCGEYLRISQEIHLTIPCYRNWKLLTFSMVIYRCQFRYTRRFSIYDIPELIDFLEQLTKTNRTRQRFLLFREFVHPEHLRLNRQVLLP
jgi:hypothetical protein